MFGKPSNPYDEIIAKATDEKQTEMNWEVALTVWDKVNEDGETGARNSVNSLTKRLTHRSANVQLFSLTLAGALVNNCGASLHREISGKSFTQALTRLINDRTTHESVKKEALKCIEEWVKEHQGNGDFDLMNDTYEALKRQNHKFPSSIERQSTPPRINDDALRREEEDLQRALAESAALTSSSSSHYTPSQPPPTSKSLPSEPSPTPTRVEALFDFTGQTPEELEFRKGDVVKVVECLYQDWWKGELRGRVGIFPRNHVQPLPDLPPVPHSNPYSHHQSNDRAPPPPSASEEELEAEVFGQIASVDRLLQLMQTLRERGEDFADNDELTDLYNSSMMLRPRVVQLIRKYDQKKSDLTGMNEKVMQARGIYEQMTGGGQPQPQQQQQQHLYAHPHQQPQTNGYAHHPAPTQSHPEPQRTFSPSHSHSQPPPAIQQQAQLDPAEEQQIREYEAKWAEYERQMEEYNRQLAAHQQLYASQQTQSIPQGLPPQSIPSSDPAQPYPSPTPHPDPQLSRSQSYTQQPPSQQAPHSPPPPQQSQQAQPQPVWDGQAWVWPTQTAHVGSQSPQIGGLVEGMQGIDLRAQGTGQQGYYAGDLLQTSTRYLSSYVDTTKMSFSSLPEELVGYIAEWLRHAHMQSVLSFCLVSHQALLSGRRALYRHPFSYHCAGHSHHPWPVNNSLLSALEDPEIGSLVRSTSGIGTRVRILRRWQTKHQREMTEVTSWYHRALQACPRLTQAGIIFSTVDDFSLALNALSLLPPTSLDLTRHPTSSITSISLEFIPGHSKVVDCQKVFDLINHSSLKLLVDISCIDISWLDRNGASSSSRFPFSLRKLFIETTQSSHLVKCSQLFPHTPYTLADFDFHSSDILGGCDLSVLPTLLDPSLRKLALCFGEFFFFNVPLSNYFSSTPGPRLPLKIFLSYPLITSLTLLGTYGPSLRLLETLAKSSPLLSELCLAGSRWISDSDSLSTNLDEIFPEPLILAALLKFARLKNLDLGTLPTSDPSQHSDLKTKLESRGIDVEYDVCREG